MKGKLYIWHRRLALIVMMPLLLFGLSGLLHPVMRLTAPEAEHRFYTAPVWPENMPVLSELPSSFPLANTAGLRPVKVDDLWYLQHWSGRGNGSKFYDLKGKAVPGIREDYAVQLARHFSGDVESEVKKVRFISEFGSGYTPINRLLPVWEVQFDRSDNLSVFVDIRQERLATLVDDKRRLFMTLFQVLHVWAFIDEDNPVRTAVFVSLMLAALVLGLSGVYLFWAVSLKRKKTGDLKKVHAWTGLLVSVALLMFVSSGLVRTLEKQVPELRGVVLNQQMAVSHLKVGITDLKKRYPLVTNAYPHLLEGEVVWQVIQPRKPDVWVSAATGQALESGGRLFASEMLKLLHLEQLESENDRLINSFKVDQHYGFIDKRLPVIALDYPEQSYYLDTRDAVLSVRVNDADKAFSWIFRYFHKWRFADGLGLNMRDALISLFVLGISLTIILGFKSWLKGRRKRRAALKQSHQRVEPTVSL